VGRRGGKIETRSRLPLALRSATTDARFTESKETTATVKVWLLEGGVETVVEIAYALVFQKGRRLSSNKWESLAWINAVTARRVDAQSLSERPHMKHADNEPELFRARAEELRAQAEEAHSLDARHVHLRLAELYERMALSFERRADQIQQGIYP